MPHKPTGATGRVKVTYGTPTSSTHEPIEFPSSKEEIEDLIARAFVRSADTLFKGSPEDVRQNVQDDWDFRIEADGVTRYLELMEHAPFTRERPSYSSLNGSHNAYDVAKLTHEKLVHKSARYTTTRAHELWLLIYTTAWQLFPSPLTISLLQYWTCLGDHSFDRIYFYSPFTASEGHAQLVYPTPPSYWADNRFEPETHKSHIVQNIDPRGWKPGLG